MAKTHESNLNSTLRIDWCCPFVARLRCSRDIASRHENRPNFRMGQIDHVVRKSKFFQRFTSNSEEEERNRFPLEFFKNIDFQKFQNF